MTRRNHHTPERRRQVSQFEYDRRTNNVKRNAILSNVEIIQVLFSGLTVAANQGALDSDSLGRFTEWDESEGLDFVVEPVDAPHDLKMDSARAVVDSFDHEQLAAVLTRSGQAALKLAQIVPITQLNEFIAGSQYSS
jgi:hypothetical protein